VTALLTPACKKIIKIIKKRKKGKGKKKKRNCPRNRPWRLTGL
jgi:hypothetical protein